MTYRECAIIECVIREGSVKASDNVDNVASCSTEGCFSEQDPSSMNIRIIECVIREGSEKASDNVAGCSTEGCFSEQEPSKYEHSKTVCRQQNGRMTRIMSAQRNYWTRLCPGR